MMLSTINVALTPWRRGGGSAPPVLDSAFARFIGADTRAGAGAIPLSNLVLSGSYTSIDTAIVSGTAAHWQGLGTNKTNFPTPASNASVTESSYTLRATFQPSGASVDVPITRVNSYTQPPATVGHPATPGYTVPTKFYTVATPAELSALQTLAQATPSAIYLAQGLQNDTLIFDFLNWNHPAGWTTFTNERSSNRSRLSRLLCRSGAGPPAITGRILVDGISCRRNTAIAGGNTFDFMFLFDGVGPTVLHDIVADGGTMVQAQACDTVKAGGLTSSIYVSGTFLRCGTMDIAGATADLYFENILGINVHDNLIKHGSAANVSVGDVTDLGFGSVYVALGLHPDTIQQQDGTLISGNYTLRRVMQVPGRGYSSTALWSLKVTGDIDVENVLVVGLAQAGVSIAVGDGNVSIRKCTFAAEPDSAIYNTGENLLFPGAAPTVAFLNVPPLPTPSSGIIERCFAHANIDNKPAIVSVANNHGPGTTDRNADVSAYFAAPITSPTAIDFSTFVSVADWQTKAAALKAEYTTAYAAKPSGPMDRGAEIDGALALDGTWNTT